MCEPSVLIVEDDAGAIEAFEPMLKAHGYKVRVACDGVTALLEIERSLPEAILLDLHLPNMNGVEFLRRLRTIPPQADIPAAVITGDYLIDDQTVRDIEALSAKIFFKPLWEEDLLKIIGELICGHLLHHRAMKSADPLVRRRCLTRTFQSVATTRRPVDRCRARPKRRRD